MSRLSIIHLVSFILYVLFQVLILKNAVLFHTAFCFLYIAFLLSLPVELERMWLLLIGFVLGAAVDVFYDSLGLHASATVLIAFLRNRWLAVLTPQGGYDNNAIPAVSAFGPQWFVTYSVPMVLVHHSVLFFTEAGGFDYFWDTLIKIAVSTIFTVLVMLVIEFIFPRKRL
ncbi:MAG: rod shape-determining protein MreD [Cyclobacteriaceae bacterium]|jgi:hypothetical protein|nr:rod shape-determining protein MreD [Cyclobacteriaceae bacterium]